MAANTYVAMLRSINVGGGRRMTMNDLRQLFSDLGHTDVASYVQSGNIVFRTTGSDPVALGAAIEERIGSELGLDVAVLIRSAAEMKAIAKKNPFLDRDNPKALHVTFLEDAPAKPAVSGLPDRTRGIDELKIVGREVYLWLPKGYADTKLQNSFFEKQLGTRATTRNWKTVLQLNEMSGLR
jgi:uncharacterized protein (DUF1697 family)